MSLYIAHSDFRTIDQVLHFFLAKAGLLETTAELEVYLTHLKHGGCNFGLQHLDCWIHMEIQS
jgi:hypothetical protein